jgi:Protein of unknown function (DUF4197)
MKHEERNPAHRPMVRRRVMCALAAALALPAAASASRLSELLKGVTAPDSGATSGALSAEEIARGLKDALAKGTERAIAELGKPDGFLRNLAVKIPMPPALEKIDKGLRRLGQEKVADEFIATMNHAAETAVADVGPIFGDALRQMTLDDAKQILHGPDDAATQYFRRTGGARIREKMRPIVQAATEKVGVTAAYKKLLRNNFVMLLTRDRPDLQLDDYITGKAADGLFLVIADEEKEIRRNPVARTTDLLKRVFGSLSR